MRPIPQGLCLGLIHEFERGPDGSFAAVPYKDPSGYWTNGWGHRVESGYIPEITAEQADAQALEDLTGAAGGVCAALTPEALANLTDGQYGACIDLAYNIGVVSFRNSTLCHFINTGAMHLAADQFLLWDHERINGKEVFSAGLLRRRQAEVFAWNS